MWLNKKQKGGFIAGVVVAAAVIGLLTLMIIFGAFLKFMSDNEKKLSDRVYFGLSSINYFYLSEKNINEFAQIVTEITAKDLGERCGGFDCYFWSGGNPSYQNLRDKFESELRGKITGFPKQIGNGGRMSFEPPEIAGLEMDDNHVKIRMKAHQVYRETKSFSVKATSGEGLEIDKPIRYLLLARIGQQLYGNGTYARDSNRVWVNSGKFDCGGAIKTISATTQLSSRTDLGGCKILEVNFNVDYLEGESSKWNSYGTKCYNIASSDDPGINAGKVEGGKIFVRIDSLLERALICGIDGTDGLASVTNVYGEVSKTSYSQPTCTTDEAKDKAWQNSGIEGKINSILSILKSRLAGPSGVAIESPISLNLQSGEMIARAPSPWSETCSCTFYSCAGACVSSIYCSVSCYDSRPNSCSSSRSSGMCSSSNSCDYSGDSSEGSISKSDSNMCTGWSSRTSTQKSWYNTGYFLETEEYRGCGSYCYDPRYSCKLGAYFKFTFTPDVEFKIIDKTGGKIVVKGTTDFEDLHFAVKFKPSEAYVVGG